MKKTLNKKTATFKKTLINQVRWTHLRELSELLITKALIILSLAPVLARLITVMESLRLDTFILKFAICGACIYSIGYLLVRLFIPEHIRNHSNAEDFQVKMNELRTSIDYFSFFKDLEQLFETYGEISARVDYERLKVLLPPTNAIARLGEDRATFVLSGALYELSDVKQPIKRFFTAAALTMGLLMMIYSIFKSITTILV